MRDAVSGGDLGEGTVAERLATAALHALAAVVSVPSARTEALRLLAADALLTYACEAALDEDVADGVDPVDRLMGALELGRFSSILEGVTGE
jgi:hypothetical protein